MKVKLTESGQKKLGKAIDVRVVNVSDVRAYCMMEEGLAVKDQSFMKAFEENPDNFRPVAPKEVSELAEDGEGETEEKSLDEMTKKELQDLLGKDNYPKNANKAELFELAIEKTKPEEPEQEEE